MTDESDGIPAPEPAEVTPRELVTSTALRVARAGYEAARVPTDASTRATHRTRLTLAVTAAAARLRVAQLIAQDRICILHICLTH